MQVSGSTGDWQGKSTSTHVGSNGTGVEAGGTATFQTWTGSHGSDVGKSDGAIKDKNDFLTATGKVQAGAMTGIDARANLVEAHQNNTTVTVGADVTTKAGYDPNSKAVEVSFLGFGVKVGGEVGIRLPFLSVSWKLW